MYAEICHRMVLISLGNSYFAVNGILSLEIILVLVLVVYNRRE